MVTVYLDPGMAFGTGTHPTTALCLEWLDGAELSGRVIIDYGCGSGILAVAAAKLGAEHVWAVDYDPQALLATRTNAKKNGVAKRISVVLPEQLPHQSVDIIVANILARPLTELAQRFAEVIHPGGDIVLSGILKEQHQTLLQAYQPWFDFNSEKSRDTWLCLTATRTGSCR